MTAVQQLFFFRAGILGIAIVLAVAVFFDTKANVTRPRALPANFFSDGGSIPEEPKTTATWLSLDSTIRSDVAMIQAFRVLRQSPAELAEQNSSNKTAQDAAVSSLRMSPINSALWMTLGLLKAQLNEPAGPTLKNSYLTGPLPSDALMRRLRAVVATDAVNDEEIRLLAQLDVRTVLTKYPRLEPLLAAAFRDANQNGKTFLLDATKDIDPRFSQLLRQYQQ